jgi:hypothetical protein
MVVADLAAVASEGGTASAALALDSAVAAPSPSTGDSPVDPDLVADALLAGLLFMDSASPEGAGSMAAGLVSAVAAGMASGSAGIGAFGPLAGGRGATTTKTRRAAVAAFFCP